ncbi:MAG: ABC transporter ATP-binding protein [Clostridiales bacterium]|jgi:simple sugar transport system ATP-binding protein|nr:ABC transporter ATP-binding protein [Clostridiales bacterium]
MELIRMTNITKVYGSGTVANESVNISLEQGEIHAIAGENGAGKSTVMKILYGIEKADTGEIFFNGAPVKISSPLEASALGIGMVHQHFMLVNELSVYENVFLGFEDTKLGFLKKEQMKSKTAELCKKYNMLLDVDKKGGALSVGEAQKVEIIKALARGARLLILDEPTAVLTPQETDVLFGQLESLRDDGCTIVIITHKLKEIKRLCARVTVMRKGRVIGTYPVDGLSESDISALMVGGEVELKVKKAKSAPGEVVLNVSGLNIVKDGKYRVRDVSFGISAGEIVCIAGVEGNGQLEAVRAVTGLDGDYGGKIEICGADIRKLSIKKIRALGLSHIPQDRMTTGVNSQSSIYNNLIAVSAFDSARAGFVRDRKLKEDVRRQMANYDIRAEGIGQRIGMLSGGNIQKAVIARELDSGPKLLVADQPTRGVDVGAIEFIHKKLVALRDGGCAVLLVSSDLAEVFNLADRILVFCEGELTAHITDPASVSEEQLGRYMLGVERIAL